MYWRVDLFVSIVSVASYTAKVLLKHAHSRDRFKFLVSYQGPHPMRRYGFPFVLVSITQLTTDQKPQKAIADGVMGCCDSFGD